MTKDKIKKVKLFIFPCEENNYRPTALDGRFLAHLALVLVFLKFISLFSFALIPKTPYFADVSRGALLKMTNQERLLAGLQPLNENPELIKAAELKAQDMLKKDYFSHWSPDGLSPWHWFSLAGYDYKYAGENLAHGFLSAKDVHRAWLASPSHKNNILGLNYNDIGIAVVEGDFHGQRTFLVVQVFGSRDILQAVLAPTLKPVVSREPMKEGDPMIDEETFNKNQSETEISPVLGLGPIIVAGETTKPEEIKHSILSFLILEYDDLLDRAIFYIIIFIGFVIMINVFIRFDIQHPDLIFKGLGFLLLFSIFNQFDQMMLIRIITDGPWIG